MAGRPRSGARAHPAATPSVAGRLAAGFVCASLLWAACPGSGPAPPPPLDWPAGALHAGGSVAAELGPGQLHRYRLPLEADQLLRLVVDQQGVDVAASLLDPRGELLLQVDRPFGDSGPELLLALAGRPGVHTLLLQAGETSGPGRYQATIEKLAPASARDRQAAAAYRLFLDGESLAGEEAMGRYRRALATWRELGEEVLEAEVLAAIGKRYWDRGDWAQAADSYRAGIAALGHARHRRWETLLRTNLASMSLPLGEAEEARRQYEAILALAREQGDRTTMAQALHGLGEAYRYQGELQKALDGYEQALASWPASDQRRAYTLHNLGVLHAFHFHDRSRGRELLAAARDAWPPSQERFKARTLKQLAQLALEEGRPAEARRHLEAALAIDPSGDPCGRAVLLARIALVEATDGGGSGDGEESRDGARLEQAREILTEHTCPRSATTVELLAANRAERRNDLAGALAGYRRCRERFDDRGDRLGLAQALLGIARVERARGRPAAALAVNGQALELLEGIRPQVLREDLRTGFFATVQDPFELRVELALETGDPAEAWGSAERARARALQDLLLEAGAGLRRGVDPALVARERSLQHRLNALGARLSRTEAGADALAGLRREMDALVEELERARGEIRRRSPAYAALTQPRPPSLAQVQDELLDEDTLLLEYRLGSEASTLWAVTAGSLDVFRLPPRREIEPLVREATAWLRSLRWPGTPPPVLCRLSRMLLAPAARLLAGRRLVVVPDGALATLPFAALPDPAAGPCPQAPPLVASHEIAYLPSAAALAVQRRLLAGREPAPGWLAVVADPVYGRDDERLAGAGAGSGGANGRGDAGDGEPPPLRRLPHSAAEAAAILAGLPPGKSFLATGFDASRETVTGGALAGFRIVHFATHGVLDADEPLLSHLALSRLDARGRPVEGDLAAHQIYDLDLPAELVVLSACDTALGRQVPGEGLVSGLPRAFLYAGAARVLMSLWAVPDEGTRRLMARFYDGLLAHGLPPARALQEAQRSLWRSGLPPYQWAGFVLQGDWRPLPPFS